MSKYQKQIREAKEVMKKNAKSCPWLYPEWQQLRQREAEFEAAKKNLENARIRWKLLSGDES